MIERQFIAQNMKENLIQEYIARTLTGVGLSHTKLVKTPSGVKVVIYASRPGLIVGKKGANIKDLTLTLKNKFNLENPQIEIAEVPNVNLDAHVVAERIASTIERFGTQRFKGVAHKVMSDVMNSGARGIEILISGKIPSARAKSWRFYNGYLKKCGDLAINGVLKAISAANLKSGTVGIQVRIMPPDIRLPDDIIIYDEKQIETQAAEEKKAEEEKIAKKEAKKKPHKKNHSEKKQKQAKKEHQPAAQHVESAPANKETAQKSETQ